MAWALQSWPPMNPPKYCKALYFSKFKQGLGLLSAFTLASFLGMTQTSHSQDTSFDFDDLDLDLDLALDSSQVGFLSPKNALGPDFWQKLDPMYLAPKPAPLFTFQERLERLSKEDVLSDPLQRIDRRFQVSQALEKRVGFWLDIYTQYGANDHVIHHSRFPWIVFEVVDTTEFLNGRGALWYRRQKGQDHVRARQREIRQALERLSKRRSFNNLRPLEQHLFDQLSQVPGRRQAVFKLASESVRSQLGQRDFIRAAIRRSGKYLSYMEAEFERQGLPVELTRLPIVESSFNERAQSRVGASGIWQIMPRTGSAYMIVNANIDERNAPLKATHQAGRLLRQYHRSLKSWELAVTAYNHGVGNIRRAISGAQSNDLATIIARYHQGHFRFASANFYASFLAALYAEKYQDVLFPPIVKMPLQQREVWTLSRQVRINDILDITGLDRQTLIEYNLDLRRSGQRNILLPRGFELHLPKGTESPRLSRVSRPSTPRAWVRESS